MNLEFVIHSMVLLRINGTAFFCLSGRFCTVYIVLLLSFLEGRNTFAVGHLALGYLTGKMTSKLLDVKTHVPLLFFASVLPDVDLVLGLEHRGPTHSLIVYALVFVPAFWLYGKRSLPFFASLTQHVVLGDLLTGGVQMLWPVASEWYGLQVQITSAFNISLEWAAFSIAMGLLWKTGDVTSLFQHHPTNLLLTIPVFTIILPAFLSYPIAVPVALIAPHLVFLALLALSIVMDLKQILRSKH